MRKTLLTLLACCTLCSCVTTIYNHSWNHSAKEQILEKNKTTNGSINNLTGKGVPTLQISDSTKVEK